MTPKCVNYIIHFHNYTTIYPAKTITFVMWQMNSINNQTTVSKLNIYPEQNYTDVKL